MRCTFLSKFTGKVAMHKLNFVVIRTFSNNFLASGKLSVPSEMANSEYVVRVTQNSVYPLGIQVIMDIIYP